MESTVIWKLPQTFVPVDCLAPVSPTDSAVPEQMTFGVCQRTEAGSKQRYIAMQHNVAAIIWPNALRVYGSCALSHVPQRRNSRQ
jgi:hypothetical protein